MGSESRIFGGNLGFNPIGRNLKRESFLKLLDELSIGSSIIRNEDCNESFKDFLEEKFQKELNEIYDSIIEIKNRKEGLEINQVGNFYVELDEPRLKIGQPENEEIFIVNFNSFGKIIKKIVQQSFIEDFSILNDKLVVSKEMVDEVNFFIRELYFILKLELSKRYDTELNKVKLMLYVSDMVTWTVTVSTGTLIYAVIQEFLVYTDGLIVKTQSGSRSSLIEKASQTYNIKFQNIHSFKGLTPIQDTVVKMLPILKGTDFSGDLGEFFIKVKGLGETIYKLVLEPADLQQYLSGKEIFILDTALQKFLLEYIDFVNLNNTLPEELKVLKEELAMYKSAVGLGIINVIEDENSIESNPIKVEILRLESLIENFEINYFGFNISSFVKFLVTKIELKDLPFEYHEYLKDTAKDKKDIEETVKNFDRIFRDRIIGQDQVIKSIWPVLKKWYIGLRSQKPVGSFLFCGPTGVGKTETAKLLADVTFGNLITLDMSEYQTEIDATKIIGVAPGYSGYDQGAGILDKIAANPRSVILFDEIEKAHYKIFDLLLQVLDEGRLTDHKGNIVSFKECFVICTTNAHYSEIEHLGDNARAKMIEILCGSFRKEFLARFDDVLKYNHLSDETMEKIFDLKMDKEIQDVSKSTNLEIIIIEDENYFKKKSDIIKFLDNSLGARELQRIITKEIISEIINYVAEMNNYREKVVFYFDTEGKLKVSMLEVSDD